MNASPFVINFLRVRLLVMLLLGGLSVCAGRAAVPVITSGPQQVTLALGQSAVLGVQATGTPPLSYQWHRNGIPIVGATSASHAISSVNDTTTGVWAVKVTDGDGLFTFAFCRVANPGAVMQFYGNIMGMGTGAAAGTAVPVALSDGDVSFAITDTGGLLWTDRSTDSGYDVTLSVLETPPPGSQPAGLGAVVQIAAHGPRVAVLQADGTVRAWTRTKLDWEPQPMGTWSHAPVPLPLDAQRGKWVFIDERCLWVVRWDGTVAAVELVPDPLTSLPSSWFPVAALVTTTHLTGANPATYGTQRHALALHEDGTVTAWGANENGQTDVPPGLTDVVEVVAGHGWSLARKRDGTLVQWGAEQTGPVIPGPLQLPPLEPTPPPAGTFRHIRAEGGALALRTDGQMASWSPFTWMFVAPSPQFFAPPPPVSEVLDFGNRRNGGFTGYLTTALCRAVQPVIVHEPEGRSVFAGEGVTLSVEATGRPLPSYQWFKGAVEIPNATAAELKINNFTAVDAASYTVRVSNLHGEVTSAPAVLSLAGGPEITTQPQNAALRPGAGTTLSLTATGSGALAYRWFKNGRVIPGAISSSLVIPSGLPADAGVYQAEVTDANGLRRSRLVRAGEGCSATGWHDGASVSYLEATQYAPGDVFLALSEGEGWLGIGVDGNLGWFFERSSSASYAGYSPNPMAFPTSTGSLNVVAAAARERMAVALDRDGGVTAWESNTQSLCVAPTAIGNYSMSCWPYGNHRPLSVPAAAQGATAVSISSGGEALALRVDGRVIGWNVRWATRVSVPAAVNASVTAICSGKDHHLALKTDGSVIAWGDNSEGECAVPSGLINVIGISALENVSFAILVDGSVIAWGDNSLGQIDVPAGLNGVASIRGARGTVLATKGDGTLVVWGSGAASSVPASMTAVRAAGVMPIDPQPLWIVSWGGNGNFTSYGVALVPVAPPAISAWSYTVRVFPGFSGNIASAHAASFPRGSLNGAWLRNGVPISSTVTTGSSYSLSLTNVTSADAGEYRVACDNGWQTGYSNIIQLEVVQPRLFTNWQSANFTPAEIATGLAAPSADPGGFGITNLMRYALGLDVRSPQMSSMPGVTFTPASTSQSGGMTLMTPSTITLSFEVPQDTADVGIYLESSTDLSTWTRTGYWPNPGALQNGRRQASFNAPGPSSVPAIGNLGNLVLGGASVVLPVNRVFYRIAIERSTPSLVPRY